MSKLTDAKVKSGGLKQGRLSDGGGLYLNVSPTGSKSWLFMWVRDGKRREMGLGGYPAVPLQKARLLADACRKAVAEGRDPLLEKNRPAEPSFAECVDLFLASIEGSWHNPKHRAQWRMTLTTYCQPLRDQKVSHIGTDDVLSVLSPIWQHKPETASRLRGRIERVLDFARVRGWREGENPALWRGHLANVLPPRQKLTRGHHAAMPFADVPSFFGRLQGSDAMAARALQVLILTAARSGEILNARWDEFDLSEGVWSVPAQRMKAGRLHRVPLIPQVVAILTALGSERMSDYVFPGRRPGRPLSSSAMEMLLRRLKTDQYTTHGFRSAFRDWVGDSTEFSRDIAEATLAHRVGDATEQAYRRSDALDKRRRLMVAWANYVSPGPTLE
ncbi:MAG: integrase arm-type DNA-binding domain-containing protein [Devosia sp.]|nr:integrase arm-type DNA-binding domain-containing protein [Devosia sp.]